MSRRTALLILVLLLGLATVSHLLFATGMFVDGIVYSAVAMNIHEGWGDFWNLHYTATLYRDFNEHPSLGIWIQSLWMDLFGTSSWSDKWFSVCCIYIQLMILKKIIDDLFYPNGHSFPFPLFFFILTPLTLWMIPNNLLENTMGIFTSLSVLWAIQALKKSSSWRMIFSGISITAALYCKGPVGLFPLALLPIQALVNPIGISRMVYFRLWIFQLLALSLSFFAPLLLFPAGLHQWQLYWDRQIVYSLSSLQTVSYRGYILQALLLQLAPALLLLSLLTWIFKKQFVLNSKRDFKKGIIWILFGLSGVIPIMISMKQREYYLFPALPFFYIGICILFQPTLDRLDDLIKKKFTNTWITASIVLLSIWTFYQGINSYGNFARDHSLLHDLQLFSDRIPSGSTIAISHALSEQWSLYAYGYRFYHWSFDDLHSHPHSLSAVAPASDTLSSCTIGQKLQLCITE